ncbi:hypothetical protein [Neorhizobium alkalisoli]|uniref:hypothetical protein n=1 Tax=Neorhizobium alkalisoli TaxID=528178 RepID=UPI000CF8F58A|nr:hypothetical protein [Neorhizobium alkalisoli]
MRLFKSKSRYERLIAGEVADRPVLGAGLRIELENGHPAYVHPVEHSLVLHVEQRRVEEAGRRRLSLAEWSGKLPAPEHASRHVADIFAVDSAVLDFAITAMREKIERDAVAK